METSNPQVPENPKNESIPQLGYDPSLDKDLFDENRVKYLESKNKKEAAADSREVGFARYVERENEKNLFASAGVAPYIINSHKSVMGLYDGNWRNSVINNDMVKIVTNDTKMQDGILSGEVKDFSTYQMKDDRLALDRAPEDIAFKEIATTPHNEEMKLEEMNSTPTTSPSPEETVSPVAASPDFPPEWALTPKEGEITKDGSVEYTEYTKEKFEDISEEYRKNIIESNAKVENVERALEGKKNGAMERLKNLGLKTLDGYRNMKPRNKLLMGVALAGASVATGGIAGGVLSMAMKGLSAGSSARGFYEKILAKEEEQGNEVNKKWLAARSILYGAVLAMGTSMVISEVASHVHIDTEGLMHDAQERMSAMKEGLKSLFGIEHVAALDVQTAGTVVPDVSPEAALSSVVEVEPGLGAYTVTPGDNLTKIVREHVLSSLQNDEAFKALSDNQRNNMIENLFKQAVSDPANPAYATLAQFNGDLNTIHPGQVLDLDALKTGLTKTTYDSLGGGTLLEHASHVAAHAPTPEVTVPSDVDRYIVTDALTPPSPIAPAPQDVINSPEVYTEPHVSPYITPEVTPAVDISSPINLQEVYTMKPGDNINTILHRVLLTMDDAKGLPEAQKEELIKKFTKEWSGWFAGFSTPHGAIKEMLSGQAGSQVHHLDHVRDAFATLLSRANNN